MNEEPDLNPEQVDQESKPYNPVTHFIIGTIVIFVIGSFLAALSAPMFIRSKMKSHKTEAINNARQIGLALFAFEDEYGSFPSDDTISQVNESSPDLNHDLSSNSSNAAFRQLMMAGVKESETMFYAKIKGTRKSDGDISPGEALKKGEVGFSYISGISSKNDPKTPIVLTPLIPGTKKFDPEPFDGKAFVLHIDNSVTAYEIKKDGTIHDKDGDILSSKHPFWNGKAPDIRYPE